jgi:hypothetical protein
MQAQRNIIPRNSDQHDSDPTANRANREGRVGREVADQRRAQRRQSGIAPLVCSANTSNATLDSKAHGMCLLIQEFARFEFAGGQDGAAPVKQSKKTMWNDRSLRDSLRNKDSDTSKRGEHQKEAPRMAERSPGV